MGFNKRFMSEKSITSMANSNNYEDFFNYFKSDAIITLDKFSSDVFNKIQKLSIIDKDDIIKIMNDINKK